MVNRRIVGLRGADKEVQVGALDEGGSAITVIAGLTEFWSRAAELIDAEPGGPTLAIDDVTQVPPVLPGARVICIGLNYLKHVAEGSYADAGIPPHPTLFARWTASLTVG